MLLIAALWVGAVHWLAAKRQRSIEAAVLASVLVFNHTLYWGFYSFLVGLPVFVAWFLLLSQEPRPSISLVEGVLLFFTALLLFAAHALWFAAGMVWFALSQAAFRVPRRTALLRFASFSPVVAAAALWYPSLATAGFISDTDWGVPPLQRLLPNWMVDAAFGGLRGLVEPALLVILALWMLLGLWQNRGGVGSRIDRHISLVAALFLAFSFVLPYKHALTIEFAERWFPVGLALLILALPSPVMNARSVWRAATLVVLGGFCIYSAIQWAEVDRNDYSGLRDAIQALPQSPDVLGIDYTVVNPVLKLERPFLQTFAYAQVVKGGTLNFSFAERASSFVVYHPRRLTPWTEALDWYPDRVTDADLAYFSHVIIGGPPRVHEYVATLGKLEPVTASGVWRLYRVTR